MIDDRQLIKVYLDEKSNIDFVSLLVGQKFSQVINVFFSNKTKSIGSIIIL